MSDEKTIPPPSSPLTVGINRAVLAMVFDWFAAKYLPAFEVVITSEYRTASHNREVNGAENSAHLHGLARDFVLKYKNGQAVPALQLKSIFTEFIAPNWPGFALFEGDHVHVNLTREISTYAGFAGVGLIGLVGYKIISSIGGSDHG